MISFKATYKFKKLKNYLKTIQVNVNNYDILKYYAERGVALLKQNTPKDSGKTAESWTYKIEKTNKGFTIKFINTNTNNGCNIAIILQYGHATMSGSFVEGIDYINPIIKPLFKELQEYIRKEVKP